ncbi:MAG: ribonuclease III [Treponema sp.]|jgi:ribonuclease-3|nr:ribonuclease III [Treponema sp.]
MHTNLLSLSKSKIRDPKRLKELAAFQKAASFKFKDIDLLNTAFMHRSISNETNIRENNECLEFLGDSILGAVCAALLYKNYSNKAEGDLAKIKSVVVSEDILSEIALGLGIDKMLLLGKGEELSGGRTKKAILADAMEAVIGALYLDSGYKVAFDFVSNCIAPKIDRVTIENYHRDYKSALQELCQRHFHCYPEYYLVKKTGPEHDHIFWMEIRINGKAYGIGSGRSKKTAEQEAAKIAYSELDAGC